MTPLEEFLAARESLFAHLSVPGEHGAGCEACGERVERLSRTAATLGAATALSDTGKAVVAELLGSVDVPGAFMEAIRRHFPGREAGSN